MYHGETGSVLGEQKSCTHEYIHDVRTLLPYQTDGKEYLLEGCTGCTVIRVYECPLNSAPISHFQITPTLMCKGPRGTVLVLNETNKSITQLHSFAGKIQCCRSLFFDGTHASDMRYSDKYGHLIIMDDEFATKGLDLETAEVVWQQRKIESPYLACPFCPFTGPTLPDGRICFLSFDKLIIVDPKDGTVMLTPLEGVSPSTRMICSTEDNQIVSVVEVWENDTRISCYEIQMTEILRRNVVPLRDIVPDDPDHNVD